MNAQFTGSQDLFGMQHTTHDSWVVVDPRIDDPQALTSLIATDHKVILLDSDRDGVEQISALLLSSKHLPKTLHLVSHGAPGTLYLGNGELNLQTVENYAEQLQSWSIENLYIYGCNVAAGDAGAEFLAQLTALTKANIAASTHVVGHASLGGSWQLDYQLGEVERPSFVSDRLVEDYVGAFVTVVYTQTEDNENNARTGTPDGDFGPDVKVGNDGARPSDDVNGDLGQIQPIEFNIEVDQNEVVAGTAFLFLSVFDVDDPNGPGGEVDRVSFNDTVLGFLEGENDLTFRSVFEIDPALINTGTPFSPGKNFVQIEVDINDNGWEASIDEAALLVNYTIGETGPNGSAFIDTISTDKGNYMAGETVQFQTDFDTNLASQNLQLEPILRDPSGTAVEFDSRLSTANFGITGTSDADAFTWNVALPGGATSGIWSIDVSAFDADTGVFQVLGRQRFQVGNIPPTPEILGAPSLVNNLDPFTVTIEFLEPVTGFALNDISVGNGTASNFQVVDGSTYTAVITPNGGGDISIDVPANIAQDLDSNPNNAASPVTVGLDLPNPVFPIKDFAVYNFLDEGQVYAGPSLDTEVGGLRMASLYDETFYLGRYPDVAAVVENGDFVNGFQHFLRHGIFELRDPSLYFNHGFYLSENPDVQNAINQGAFTNGLQHYLLFGHLENRDPSALFDADDYLTNNPDVANAVAAGAFDSGFDHYIEFGAREGRINTLLYEEAFYLEQNPDVKAVVDAGFLGSGFDHYITAGQKEGRDPSPLFDESAYLGANPDVAAVIQNGDFSSGMEHYFRHGRQEGRPAFAVSVANV